MPGHRVAIYSLADYTEIERTAETNRFLVVYAEQEFRWDSLRWAWWTDWDWNRLDPHPDLVFLERLVERITDEYNIDRTRVFAAGHSRGASMSLIAALELPDIFAGATSQSGFTELHYDVRVRAYEGRHVPLYFVHGVADDDVCIDCTSGGRCGVAPTRTCGSVESSDSLVDILRDKGWSDDELLYRRLDNVAHRWQPQLNQEMWDFLAKRPLPAEALR